MSDNSGMVRPCFLVVDREYPGSISTRKLVIETAKLNVITAYSGAEALLLLEKFPAVSGVVVDAGIEDLNTGELVRRVKNSRPKLPVIVIAAPGFHGSDDADYQLDSFSPAKLLELLRRLEPEEAAEIERHDEDLSRSQKMD